MKILKKVILTVILAIFAILIMTCISKAATVKVTGDTLNIRKGPSTDTQIIAMLSKGVECEMLGEEDNWYKIKYKSYTGYISKDYSELVKETSTNKEETQENKENNDSTNKDESSTNNTKKNNTSSENKKEEQNKETTDKQEENKETTDKQEQNKETNNNQTEQNNEKTETKLTYKKFNKDVSIKILPLIHSSNIGNAKKNEEVLIVTETSGWSYVQTNTINGWVRSDALGEEKTVTTSSSGNKPTNNSTTASQNTNNTTNSTNNTSVETKTAYINEELVNLRKGAGTNYNIVKVLTLNTTLTILGEEGTWYKVKTGNDIGYVSKEFISETKTVITRSNDNSRIENSETTNENETIIGATDGEDIEKIKAQVTTQTTTKNNTNNNTNTSEKNTTSSNTEASKNTNKNSNTTSAKNDTTKGTDIVAYAKKYLGHKYVYGGNGSNGTFDCSGFTMYVYKHFGISLPHGANAQYKSGKGTKISKQSQLQTGDIVFLTDYETGVGIGHCGIYIGDGNFIHASTTTYTVTISSLNTMYEGRFYAGLRLI